MSYNKLGDVQVAQGDLAAALKSYRDGLAIFERLAQSDPATPIGSVILPLVIRNSRTSIINPMIPMPRLPRCGKAKRSWQDWPSFSPDNAGWQRDLAWFDEQIAALTK